MPAIQKLNTLHHLGSARNEQVMAEALSLVPKASEPVAHGSVAEIGGQPSRQHRCIRPPDTDADRQAQQVALVPQAAERKLRPSLQLYGAGSKTAQWSQRCRRRGCCRRACPPKLRSPVPQLAHSSRFRLRRRSCFAAAGELNQTGLLPPQVRHEYPQRRRPRPCLGCDHQRGDSRPQTRHCLAGRTRPRGHGKHCRQYSAETPPPIPPASCDSCSQPLRDSDPRRL